MSAAETPRAQVVVVSRELHPFSGGGIAPVIAALAGLLGREHEVTIITSDAHRDRWEQRTWREGYGERVALAFAQEPGRASEAGFLTGAQAWSAAVYACIAERFAGTAGPDLIEFPDYLGEGFVTLQARRTGDPLLAATRVAVRAHTTAEMTSVLNGALADDLPTRTVLDMERYCLRHADWLLTPGGDIRASYERFYGRDALAPSVELLDAFSRDFAPVGSPSAAGEGDLRLLVLGRLERRKGPQTVVRALRGTEREGWRVSFLGGDTDTAPLGTSMRSWLEAATAGDDRFAFLAPVARREVGRVIAEHDVVVTASLWECWPNTVREAYAHGRPVLATPVGGLTGLVEHGVTGWLAAGTSATALRDALESLLDDPAAVRALHDSPALRDALDRVDDPEAVHRGYARLLAAPRPRSGAPAAPRDAELVSVLVPYHGMARHVEETLASVAAQTWPAVEVVVVNDGSFAAEDQLLLDVAPEVVVVSQANRGLGAARNLAADVSRGAFLLPLDPDDLIDPDYISACMAALAAAPELAYVTTWAKYIDERGRALPLPDNGYTPLGNWSPSIARNNVGGVSTALFRREALDSRRWDVELTSYEDWMLYRDLHDDGRFGDVIPRRLFSYRVRTDSMARAIGLRRIEVLEREMRARRAEATLTGQPA